LRRRTGVPLPCRLRGPGSGVLRAGRAVPLSRVRLARTKGRRPPLLR
jgi:hypothetical protein